ncbi:hypothetical protein [Amaricoccus sp. W119]|uniref:hypothetical protein n=1 Tax=Amaricoccus sp. W119 TaxID=3391833 RepID=UPI0039A6F4FD
MDDLAGVVVDVAIVTGEEHDTGRFTERLDAIEEARGSPPDRITADTIHGVGRVYAALEDRRIEAVIPPLRSPRRKGARGFPTERFRFDPHHDAVRCPARKRLVPRDSTKSGKWYRADRRDRACCALKRQCLPLGAPSRRVHIVTNHAAMPHAPGANALPGVKANTQSTPATAGGSKARTAPRRRSTDLPEPSAGARKHEDPGTPDRHLHEPQELAAALMLLLRSILEMCAAQPNPAPARNDFFNSLTGSFSRRPTRCPTR